jgi:hypothetical protein
MSNVAGYAGLENLFSIEYDKAMHDPWEDLPDRISQNMTTATANMFYKV